MIRAPFIHRDNEGTYLIWRFTRRYWLLLGAWKART